MSKFQEEGVSSTMMMKHTIDIQPLSWQVDFAVNIMFMSISMWSYLLMWLINESFSSMYCFTRGYNSGKSLITAYNNILQVLNQSSTRSILYRVVYCIEYRVCMLNITFIESTLTCDYPTEPP